MRVGLSLGLNRLGGFGGSEGPSAGLWTPSEITTRIWLDADDATTITDSLGAVSQWRDKSGNLNHFNQASANNQAQTGTDFNGLNAITFVGGSGSNNGDHYDSTSTAGEACDYVCVLKADSGFTTHILFLEIGGAAGFPIAYDASSSTALDQVNGVTSPAGLDLLFNGETTESVTTRDTLHTAFTAAGGVVFSAKNVPDFDTSDGQFSIGAQGTGSFDGDIAEIVVIPTNATNRQLVEGYLAWKWGLEGSLDAGHPYKSAAPTV